MNKQDEILNLLIEGKNISSRQASRIKQAVVDGSKSFTEAVLEFGAVDAEELVKLRARAIAIPYQNLIDKKISEDILNVIPVEVSENYRIICFQKDARKIGVGVVDPENLKAIEAVTFLAKEAGMHVQFFLVSESSFDAAIKQYKTLLHEVSSVLETRRQEEESDIPEGKDKGGEYENMEEVLKSAPVAKIVSVIIRHAVEGRASDIHIEPLLKESRVRYRVDGVLQTSLTLPKSIHNAVVSRIKVLASLKLDETRLPQDGRLRSNINGKEIDFRVSILPLMDSEKVVMRVLDTGKGAPSLEQLGFTGPSLKAIENNINKTEGLFLVTGPTGSGKSTTIFSIINRINKEGVNISTLEDPVEYFIPGVNQTQIRPEIGFTFASGLRTLLRQDPNVIMVGEIRDSETAELAVHAGLTGHLVFSTLHTNDAIGALPRLIDMKVEPFLLGSTINMVVAQRLARKICEHCKEEVAVPPEIEAQVKENLALIPKDLIIKVIPGFDDANKLKFYKGKGCSRCGNQGYNGRVAVAEVLEVNDKIREMILEEKKNIKLEDVIATQPFITLRQDGILKVIAGLTTMEEVLRIAFD